MLEKEIDKVKTISVVLIFALFGCAAEVMNGFVGKDVSQAVAQYGPPINAYDLPDGRRAFQWRIDKAMVMPTTTTFNGYGTNYGYGTAVSGSAMTTGGYMGNKACFYTLYTKGSGNRWTVVGYEPPRPGCM